MNVTTLDAVTYGVTDLAVAKRFWTDFGLELVVEDERRLLFQAMDLSNVEVKLASDPSLPPAIEPGPGVRESIFGVRAQADLDAAHAARRAFWDAARAGNDAGAAQALDAVASVPALAAATPFGSRV